MNTSEAGDRDCLGRSLLHLAAESNDLNRMEILLSSGKFDTNEQDLRGRSVLHCLVDENTFFDLDDMKRGIALLLDKGADVNIQDKFQDTPLHVVFYNYDKFTPEVIRFMLKHAKSPPYDMSLQNHVGYTVFYKFMSGFNSSVVESDDFEEIFHETEAFINDYINGTIYNAHPVEILLNKKDIYGFSAFQMYINNVQKDTETLKRMIMKGADVNAASLIGKTVLMDAVIARDEETVKLLLEAGADPNAKDIFGQNAVFSVQTTACFALLKEHGADFNVRDRFGRTPLAESILYTPEDMPRSELPHCSHYRPLAELFLELGLDSNEKDRHGSSLLHYAAWHGHAGMISTLLRYGANLHVVDDNGTTPFQLAKKVGNFSITSLLDDKDIVLSEDKEKRPELAFSRLIVNNEEIGTCDIKQILYSYINFKDDNDLIKGLLNSPRIGLTSLQEEATELKSDIVDLMKRLALKIASFDEHFRCSVLPMGSSAEGTKIGDVDEFDFVFCLEYFSEQCLPFQNETILNTGFAMLKLKSLDLGQPHPLTHYTDDGEVLESYIVRDTFQDLITKALNDPDIWQSATCYIFFDGLIKFSTDKPVLTLEMNWFGRTMKSIVVSIDVVPAISVSSWIPEEFNVMEVEVLNRSPKEGDFLLLLQPPEDLSKTHRKYVRISSSAKELNLLENLPYACLEGYAAAKILMSEYFCPKIQFKEDHEQTESIFGFHFKPLYETLNQNRGILEDNESEEVQNIDNISSYTNISSLRHLTLDRTDAYIDSIQNISQTPTESIIGGGHPGFLILKRGKCHETPSCVLKFDETMKLCKLFTPKERKGRMRNSSVILGEKDIYLKEQYKTLRIQEEESTWVRFEPMKVKNYSKLNDDSDNLQMTMKDITDDTTVAEWITNTLKCRLGTNVQPQTDGNRQTAGREDTSYRSGIPHIGRELPKESETCNVGETLQMETGSGLECQSNISDDADSEESHEENVDWEGGEIVEGSDVISSYMMKNCLFYVASETPNLQSLTTLDVTIKIFEILHKFAKSRQLNSYFMSFLEVFTFANTHIRNIPVGELAETLRIQCERIELFCEMMLGILRQSVDNN